MIGTLIAALVLGHGEMIIEYDHNHYGQVLCLTTGDYVWGRKFNSFEGFANYLNAMDRVRFDKWYNKLGQKCPDAKGR